MFVFPHINEFLTEFLTVIPSGESDMKNVPYDAARTYAFRPLYSYSFMVVPAIVFFCFDKCCTALN